MMQRKERIDVMSENDEKNLETNGVKPEEKPSDPLAGLDESSRKLFEDTQAGLLSALKKEREANAEAAKRIAAIEAEQQSRIEKQLEESGQYKQLADERAKALAEAQAKAEKYEETQEVLKKHLDAQIEEIPENKRSLVPTALSVTEQLDWISQNRSLLSKAVPFDTGAGKKGGSGGQSVTLSEDEMKVAQHYGMTPEEYAKHKDD
jgi:flagellar biosynthesis/type III secretory pathway protein FliH